jgi:arabinogalactan oligomer/maltooligosaccharide transport system permease protein
MKAITKKGDGVKAAAFMAPAMISIIIFTVLPIAYTIWLAFTNKTMYVASEDVKMVGLKNFVEVLNGPFKEVFFPVFGWTLIFALISTLGSFFVGLITAMLLNNEHIKERGVYKAILIIPWALPVVVAILSWQGLLNGTYGAVNNLLLNIRIISEPIPWLSDPFWARVALCFVNIWLGFPYMMNICLGALAAIPTTYYEAADVDGASKFTQFVKITMPSIAQTAYPLLISSFSFNFNNFGSAYLITSGGPARANSQYAGYTDILASVNYKLSNGSIGKYNIAAAIGLLVFILLAIISYVQMRLSGQFKEVQ